MTIEQTIDDQLDVSQIILSTIRALASGQMRPSKANAIFNGVRVLQMQNESEDSGEGPIPMCGEEYEFGKLVTELYQRFPTREWRNPEMRAIAVELSLFRGWLNEDNADSFSCMSRFGLMCDRHRNRTFGELIFTRQGKGRHRIYAIHPKITA